LRADDRSKELWIDAGTGFSMPGTTIQSANIDAAVFARYRVRHWEVNGGGWYSNAHGVSNVTVSGGYVFPLWRGLNFTGGLAIAPRSANIGTVPRFYLAGRYDFKCWSVGYVHYSNGMGTFHHNNGPNNGVNLLVLGRRIGC
jgi:hypothetical protein